MLTAWAAGKFVADAIAPFVKKCGIAEKVNHRKIIIPGAVATISGDLDEELPDWEVQIGPREGAHIAPFLKNLRTEHILDGIHIDKMYKINSRPYKEYCVMVITIAESINIMSKTIGPAMKERNAKPIQDMAVAEAAAGADFLDVNIGPARKGGAEMMEWLVKTIHEVVDLPLSLDTTNLEAMEAGLKAHKKGGRPIVNSVSCQTDRIDLGLDVVKKYNALMVGLLWGNDGMPRDVNERAALAVDIIYKANEKGIPNEDIFIDPIVTPISGEINQVLACTEFLGMLQDIAPGCKSTVGLSNVSNGAPDHLGPF